MNINKCLLRFAHTRLFFLAIYIQSTKQPFIISEVYQNTRSEGVETALIKGIITFWHIIVAVLQLNSQNSDLQCIACFA
jgi:hypothetical protein